MPLLSCYAFALCVFMPFYCLSMPFYCFSMPSYCLSMPFYCLSMPLYCFSTPFYCPSTPAYCLGTLFTVRMYAFTAADFLNINIWSRPCIYIYSFIYLQSIYYVHVDLLAIFACIHTYIYMYTHGNIPIPPPPFGRFLVSHFTWTVFETPLSTQPTDPLN